jgi:hypothetical protein
MLQLENNFPLVSCQLLMWQIVEPPRAPMFLLKTMDMLQIVFSYAVGPGYLPN